MKSLIITIAAIFFLASPAMATDQGQEAMDQIIKQEGSDQGYSERSYDQKGRQDQDYKQEKHGKGQMGEQDKAYKEREYEGGKKSGKMGQSGKAGSHQAVSMDELKDMKIVDSKGEEIGTIRDSFVNPDTGEIEFLILNVGGGVLGVGKDKAVVPYRAVKYQGKGRQIKLDQSIDKLRNAPKFNEKDLSEDRQYRESVYKHYGYDYEDMGFQKDMKYEDSGELEGDRMNQ